MYELFEYKCVLGIVSTHILPNDMNCYCIIPLFYELLFHLYALLSLRRSNKCGVSLSMCEYMLAKIASWMPPLPPKTNTIGFAYYLCMYMRDLFAVCSVWMYTLHTHHTMPTEKHKHEHIPKDNDKQTVTSFFVTSMRKRQHIYHIQWIK